MTQKTPPGFITRLTSPVRCLDELRTFLEPQAPDDAPNRGDARVVASGPHGAGACLPVVRHDMHPSSGRRSSRPRAESCPANLRRFVVENTWST